MDALHPFTLRQYFGTLTVVWVVPLSRLTLTTEPPFTNFNDVQTFGVGQKTEGFLPLNPQSVSLLFELSHFALDYDQFR